ncbi:MAG: hypothetical protein S4CHLAM37_11150 [Chlamydiia bacterium]|nr:hypothetical protein [Chlamydiia bacterium]
MAAVVTSASSSLVHSPKVEIKTKPIIQLPRTFTRVELPASSLDHILRTKATALSYLHSRTIHYTNSSNEKETATYDSKTYKHKEKLENLSPLNKLTVGLGIHHFMRCERHNLGLCETTRDDEDSTSSQSQPKYKVLNPIGKGTFGTVFEGKDKKGEKVAIKALHTCDLSYLKAAQGEAECLKKVSKVPYVLPFVESYTSRNIFGEKSLTCVTKFIPHKDLFHGILKKKERLHIDTIAAIAWKALEFLSHLHVHGVVHMDLKPANILYGHVPQTGSNAEKRAQIKELKTPFKSKLKRKFLVTLAETDLTFIDFGGSKHHSFETSNRYMQTGLYRDPTIIGTKKTLPKYDYFSMGALLWELYTTEALLNAGSQMALNLEDSYKTGIYSNYGHQLARIYTSSLAISYPGQSEIKQMSTEARNAFYTFRNNKYLLRPLPIKREVCVKHVETMKGLHAYRKNTEERVRKLRKLNKKTHEAFLDLVLNHFLRAQDHNPARLREHPFFYLVAYKKQVKKT